MAWTYEPFVTSDKFSMETMNNKLADIVGGGVAELATIGKGNCSIGVMSYIGDGKYNDTSTTITFPVEPKFYFISGYAIMLFGAGKQTNPVLAAKDALYSGSFVSNANATWSDNTLSLINSVHARYQMNEKDTTYHVVYFYNPEEN